MKNLTKTKRKYFLLLTTLLLACNPNQKKEHKANHQQRPSPSQIIKELDSNNDNKISKTEARGPIADEFSVIDVNSDELLSKNELKNITKTKRQKIIEIDKSTINHNIKIVPLNTDHFIKENIIGGIIQKKINLSGIETLCYVIKTHSQATEHKMGPWCPTNIEDGISKGGIWFDDDKVYDVSGHFIANLDTFYNDDKWKVYRLDGTIKVTQTKEGCIAAAKPNVEKDYQNYCVQCLPEYFKDQVTTFVIPVTPQYINNPQSIGRDGIGIAFNGVKFDPPAPLHAILAAHTIAPLDDHGGHVNPHGGYHYHAATGSTKEIEQTDIHSPIIGYAIDGFGIFTLNNKDGNKPKDLDECGGHSDAIRGYHYHAGKPGANQIIKCLHGIPGYINVQE